MSYQFLSNTINKNTLVLPNSEKINPYLLKNNNNEIMNAIDFLDSDEKFLYLHGFTGTGKRQFINYVCEFLHKDVIKLEYYCKAGTVCDDILLTFTEAVDKLAISKAVSFNAKITALGTKLQQQISLIRKPFLIVLHTLDNASEENMSHISNMTAGLAKEENVKIIISTHAMKQGLLGDLEEDRKIFLKALSKDIFAGFLASNQILTGETTVNDFYNYTRGYYFYAALSVKIMQAMNIDIDEFLRKFNLSNMTFDEYIGVTYINLIPPAIRNFFWFLRNLRHGINLNALAIFDIYDDFSVEYLKTNLMIFQVDETLYVHDYFIQNTDISIPEKTLVKLHKYIIGIYESQLKASIKDRCINLSRQALRAEIDYHGNCISEIEHKIKETKEQAVQPEPTPETSENAVQPQGISISEIMEQAYALMQDKKWTDAIEAFKKISDRTDVNLRTIVEVRSNLAKLYKQIGNYQVASHYYDLTETYYKQNKEFINLNYLYYDMTDLYFKMYKHQRAVDTIKKVIYSVDTPQSLMVAACTLLGNIYADMNNPQEAYSYYKKALDSVDDNAEESVLAELYFKFALANDDKGDMQKAYEYYNKCISQSGENTYKALAYSNLASCYYENESYDDALGCFLKAYEIEKNNNNYEGIYYNASKIAGIYIIKNDRKALEYLLEAESCADFLNEHFYIIEAALALGDYYYNDTNKSKETLKKYFKARKIALTTDSKVDISKIERRINDMKLRMSPEDFAEVENKYA